MKKKLNENIQNNELNDDFKHPYHTIYDENGEKMYDGHKLYLKHLYQILNTPEE